MEVVWTGLSTLTSGNKDLIGHTSVWMFFIYGLAVFVLEPVHHLISDFHWFIRGCMWCVIIFIIEFSSGLLLRFLGIEAWYYTGATSFMGLIRWDYAPLWFGVGLLFERIHNLLISYGIGLK